MKSKVKIKPEINTRSNVNCMKCKTKEKKLQILMPGNILMRNIIMIRSDLALLEHAAVELSQKGFSAEVTQVLEALSIESFGSANTEDVNLASL